MIPTPKYAIGDAVFYPITYDSSEQLPCPDCRDTKVWSVTTPSGLTFDTACLRCGGNAYQRGDIPSLTLHKVTGHVKPLTIGQVKIEWPQASTWNNDPINYMCKETGVGSGSVYPESKLFPTEAEAQAAADIEAGLATAKFQSRPEPQFQRHIASFGLKEAFGEKAGDSVWRSCYHFGQLREKVEGWLERSSEFGPSEFQANEIRYALGLDWHLDPAQNPVAALVHAARSMPNPSPELAAAVAAFAFVREAAPAEVDEIPY